MTTTPLKNDRAIRVMTVDDHPMLREGLAGAIELQHDMRLVAEAQDGAEALDAFRRYLPDVTLMDVRMRTMDGLAALKAIRAEFPAARVVMLSSFGAPAQLLEAAQAGAAGYLLKETLRKDLLDTIRAVHAGGRRFPSELAMQLAEHVADQHLTGRETTVLKLVAEGRSNKRIGGQLDIAEGTVKAHMKSILGKLAASDRTHAVTIAVRRGIIDL
ncbi:response regulator transcription factor [Mitsuaria sp. 7]|uniref:response regulator n=1 Tax=Mitsuaria sp. 7 TaxID=1658665 RepID=UPI0007DD1A50|nr:response regulator transcription factor [Mitsuaria sp. 7]ANH69182.1 LuxR family transcriptional regulator [Mitsuaria sp. 7]